MHFLVIVCFVPVILDRPGSLWNAHTRPHKSLQHCQSGIPSGPSPWLARVLLTLILPGFSASNSHLVLFLDPAFHLPGNLVLNLCYKRTATTRVFKLVCVHLQKHKRAFQGMGGQGRL